MRSLKQLTSCPIASPRQPRDGGNDNRAKVKNDGSGISPNTFEPLSLSKAVLKAAAREVSNGRSGGMGCQLIAPASRGLPGDRTLCRRLEQLAAVRHGVVRADQHDGA